jgi:hypothetical protein
MLRDDLIRDPAALRPQTRWSETVWGWAHEEDLVCHTRKPRLCPAVLLPFADSRPDWRGFHRELEWMYDAAAHYGVELVPVLNADTGYIFDLDEQMYAEVLSRFRAGFPGRRFIAGVTARGGEEDDHFRADRYRPLLDLAQQHPESEVMLMTSRHLNALDPERRFDAYCTIADLVIRPALVHALEPAFVPWATPFEPWLLWKLACHPAFIGGKISTLDEPHLLFWAAMTRDLGLDFLPHSGDDFGLATGIKLGLPLLVGAAASAAPLLCAALDLWLDDGVGAKRFPAGTGGVDPGVYKLFEAIQSLEDQVFRPDAGFSVAAYKHSTAHVLHHLGVIASPEVHPACRDRRDRAAEPARMAEAMRRAGRLAQRLQIPGFAP